MKLIYTPSEGERQEWTYDPNRMTIGEVVKIEDTSDQTLEEFMDKVSRGSFKNLRVLFWLMMRRSEPSVALTDLDDIEVSALGVEDDTPAEDDEAPKGGGTDGTSDNEASS